MRCHTHCKSWMTNYQTLFTNSTEVSSNQLQCLLCTCVFQNRIQIQGLLWQLIWNKYLRYNKCKGNQYWLQVHLLWKVDFGVIANSLSCLCLDQILMLVFDKSCSYRWSWSSFITLSLDRSGSDTEPKLYCASAWWVFRWSWNWRLLGWSSQFIPFQSRSDQRCSSELSQGLVEERMSHQRLMPISPCFHYFLPGNRPISPCLSVWNPICIRRLVRKVLLFRDVVERRMSYQRVYWTLLWISPCFWDWSLSFLSLFLLLMLERIEQYCSELFSWFFTLVICQSSILLRFWFLETWQPSLTLAVFLTSRSSRIFMVLWLLMLLVVSQTLLDFQTLVVFRLSRQLRISWKPFLLSKESMSTIIYIHVKTEYSFLKGQFHKSKEDLYEESWGFS